MAEVENPLATGASDKGEAQVRKAAFQNVRSAFLASRRSLFDIGDAINACRAMGLFLGEPKKTGDQQLAESLKLGVSSARIQQLRATADFAKPEMRNPSLDFKAYEVARLAYGSLLVKPDSDELTTLFRRSTSSRDVSAALKKIDTLIAIGVRRDMNGNWRNGIQLPSGQYDADDVVVAAFVAIATLRKFVRGKLTAHVLQRLVSEKGLNAVPADLRDDFARLVKWLPNSALKQDEKDDLDFGAAKEEEDSSDLESMGYEAEADSVPPAQE